MLRAHNSVKAVYDGNIQICPNSVLDFSGCLNPDKPYAAYIVSGAFKEEARLESFNSDPQGGILYAEYSAAFEKSEYDGVTFEEFSLSPDGEKKINTASITPVTKETGKAVNVSVTVYLELSSDSANCFMGGQNPLIEYFLGKSALRGSAGIISGVCNMKTKGVPADIDESKIRSAEFFAGGGKVTFSAVSPTSEPEVIFTIGNKPVIRVYAYEKRMKLRTGTSVVRDDYTFALDANDVEDMISVSIGGASVMGGHIYHGFNKLFKIRGLVEFDLPLSLELKSDCFERFAAAANEKEVFFFDAENGEPKLLYRLPLEGYNGFDVCENGYLALFGQKLRLYAKDRQFIEYPIFCEGFTAVFNEGAHFFCFNYNTATRAVKTYKLKMDGTFSTVINETAVGGIAAFKSFFGVYLLSNNNIGALVRSDIAGLTAQPALSAFCAGADKILAVQGLVYANKNNGHYLATEDNTQYTLSAAAEVRRFDKFLAASENGTVSLLYFDRALRTLVKTPLEGFCDLNEIKSVAAIGDYLLVCDSSDRISTYYRNRSSAYIWYGGFAKGQTASYTAAVRGAYNYTKQNLKTTVTIEAIN